MANTNNSNSNNSRTFGVEFELFFTNKGWVQFVYDNRDVIGPEVMRTRVPREDRDIFMKAMNSGNAKKFENEVNMFMSDNYDVIELVLYKKLGFPKSWETTSDQSINGGQSEAFSIEIVTPPLSEASGGFQEIVRFCRAFKPYASVNKSTGLHVHVDAREFVKKSEQKNLSHRLLVALMSYKSVEPLFDQLVAASRRGNKNKKMAQATPKEEELYGAYKAAIKRDSKDLESYISTFQGDRYNKLNLWSLEKHGTLEFRQMHGTLNEKLIIGWTKLALNFIEQVLKTDAELRSYFIEQQKLIKNQYGQVKKDLETQYPKMKDIDIDLIIDELIHSNDDFWLSRVVQNPKDLQNAKKIIFALKNNSVDSRAAIDYLKQVIAKNQKNLVPTRTYNQAKQAYQANPLAEEQEQQEQ